MTQTAAVMTIGLTEFDPRGMERAQKVADFFGMDLIGPIPGPEESESTWKVMLTESQTQWLAESDELYFTLARFNPDGVEQQVTEVSITPLPLVGH